MGLPRHSQEIPPSTASAPEAPPVPGSPCLQPREWECLGARNARVLLPRLQTCGAAQEPSGDKAAEKSRCS